MGGSGVAMALYRRRKNGHVPSSSVTSGDAAGTPPASQSEVTPLKDGAKDTREGDAPWSPGSEASPSKLKQPGPSTIEAKGRETFRVTRFVILRLVGLVYFVAFLGAYNQNKGLLGKDGLIPAHEHWTSLLSNCKASKLECFKAHPSLYWFLDVTMLGDETMDYTAITGMTLSMLVVLGLDSFLVMIALWLLDFSIVTSAEHTSFYSYGWESQLLETGWLAVWLCDVPILQSRTSEPSLPVLWLFRWLCARISVGAGLIKLRGAQCWQERTCLYYHFETQPIPSPSSFFFHFLPKSVLRGAVHLDFFVQLYTIWLVLLPGWTWHLAQLRRLGGFVQAGFMINIILSGNFAFLNHLTIVPALACLDDTCFPSFLRHSVNRRYYRDQKPQSSARKVPRYLLDLGLLALISTLSMPVVQNLLQIGGRQVMNTSFGSFKLVNSYGAFGSVGQARYEPIIAVSEDGVEWTELELPCKPGNVRRRPW